MKLTVMQIVVGGLETVPKRPWKNPGELEIRGKIETIHTKSLLKLITH